MFALETVIFEEHEKRKMSVKFTNYMHDLDKTSYKYITK